MLTRFLGIVLGLCGCARAAQLYLITGSPEPRAPEGYTSTLFRVEDGTLVKVVDLVTDKGGTDWIATSQDFRKAVLAPKDPERYPVVVVDFDQGAPTKQCVNADPGGPIERWLLDLPGIGPAYGELLGSANGIRARAMALNAEIPCDRSFAPISPSEVKHLVASGAAGVAESGGSDWMPAGVAPDGTVTRFFGPGLAAYFDYRVPPPMFSDLKERSTIIVANNRQLFAISLIDYPRPNSRRLAVFRKSDKTWHRMPDFTESTDYLRAFGSFIASVAASPKSTAKGESAGRSEWRTQIAKTGPSISGMFAESYAIFPGHLYVYDVETDRTYSINTGQGDSEVLLIEKGVVYYRASDRLYGAAVSGASLTPGRLLATSEAIRDAHWAFLKP